VKVVLLALGSRGDVQPMIALGKALKAAGKPVTVVALRDFAPLVEEAGLALAPIDSRLDEALDAVSGSARGLVLAPSALGLPVSRHRLPRPSWRRWNRATSSSQECCRSMTP